MAEEMKPTVGRIVLFRVDEENTFPAIVVRVHPILPQVIGPDLQLINLRVFKDFVDESFTSVHQGDEVGQWNWMPFQRDQQKRVELMADAEVEKRTNGASITGEEKK